ncbi:exonuclease SbcC [Deinobacterium chartae]|uniref:Exonuclease SbcC n=1 Tax=Deinobacterium chartae TaxID=521158 RepID=A0A841I5U3_9DEIO|nr:SMC family ATPase [Deinobacterium chartae]MBB6099245.1 exonuclease SbcC [Deinobacterium chartae]
MRPLKLSMSGFTCFREYVEVNFEGLELYAIVGPTGSGKSSLLDAITFALYGQTPRLGSKGMDALISQGERGLSVALEFEVGGERYRVGRTKGRKAAESEVRFERQDGNSFVTATPDLKKKELQAAIERVVGLSFDSFTRAVLLPQGEFDRFLKGTGKERQELLGALLDLQHYRAMQEHAKARASAFKSQIDALNARLGQEYARLTAETLEAARESLEATRARAVSVDGELKLARAELEEARHLVDLHTRLKRAEADLARAEAEAPAYAEHERRAREARAVAGVLPLLEAETAAAARAARAEADLARAEEALEAARKRQQQAAAALLEAGTAAATLPDLEARLARLGAAERDARRLSQLGAPVTLEDPEALPWDEEAFSRARETQQRRAQLDRDLAALAREEADLGQTAERLAAQRQRAAHLKEQSEALIAQGKQLRAEADAAEAQLQQARAHDQAHALRAQLAVGEPCPVCEAVVRTLPKSRGHDLAALEAELKTRRARLEAMREQLTELRGELSRIEGGLEAEVRAWQDRDRAATARRTELEAAARELAAAPDGEREQRRLLAGLAAAVRAVTGGEDFARLRARLEKERADLQTALERARRASGDADLAVAAATAARDSLKTACVERSAELAQARAQLLAALADLGLDAAQVRSRALPETRIRDLERDVAAWYERLEGLGRAVTALRDEFAGRPFDPAREPELRERVRALEGEARTLAQNVGTQEAQLTQLEAALQRKRELEREAAQLGRQYDTWAALAQSLQSNEFQRYLLLEVEAELLARAGELLAEISDERYSLALEEGEYVVMDRWNAGETRAVRTLSGGETFIASLSLAIALSEYLAGNRRLGALFLDEGFGTLDPQALEAVAGALEKLRVAGRAVGVITHVASLAERLPSRLMVTKGVGGSRLSLVD